MKRRLFPITISLATIGAAFSLVGCGGDDDAPEHTETAPVAEPAPTPAPAPAPATKPKFWSEVALHSAIREVNPGYSGNGEFQIENGKVSAIRLAQCGVTNLTPLAGMELAMLDLQA